MTTTGASAEEYDPKDSMTTPEASVEDLEGTARPRIHGQQWRLRRRNGRYEELATITEASLEEFYTKDSATTTTDALAEEAEETTRPIKGL